MSSGFPPGTWSVDTASAAGLVVALQVRSSNTETVPVEPDPLVGDVDGVGGRVRPRQRAGYVADGDGRRCRGASGGMGGVAARGCRSSTPCSRRSATYAVATAGSAASPPARSGTAGARCRQPLVGLRVAARRVDHRDVVVDLVGGVQRLGLRVEADHLRVGAGVDLGRVERCAP